MKDARTERGTNEKKTLKKVLIVLLVVVWCIVLLPLFAIFLSIGLRYYVYQKTQYVVASHASEFSYHGSDAFGKRAYITGYLYDPASGQTEITIPENIEEYPVVALGVHDVGPGTPFRIEIDDIRLRTYVRLSEGSSERDVQEDGPEREYIDLVLNIGPNIKDIFADQSGLETRDKLYIVRVYIHCDPGNTEFYSENGRLYTKSGELVEGFLYWDMDY